MLRSAIRSTVMTVLRRVYRGMDAVATRYGIAQHPAARPSVDSSAPLRAFYAHFIEPGDLCFDVGTNSGNRTEVFLSLGARVICIEPQPQLAARLREKFGDNPDVTVVAAGCAAEPGTLRLALCEGTDTVATFSDRWKTGRFSHCRWGDSVEVPVTTLDELITRHGAPAFCKIDVEGFEKEVLRGLTRPMKVVSYEYTKEFFDDAQSCLELLARNGLITCNYSIGESPFLMRTTWDTPEVVLGDILLRDDPEQWGDIYVRSQINPTPPSAGASTPR